MTTSLVNARFAVKDWRTGLPLLLLLALLGAPRASFGGVTYTWIPSDGSPSSGTLTIDAPRCGGFSVSQTAVSAFAFSFAPGLTVDLNTNPRRIVVNGEGEVIPIVSSDGSSLDSGVLDLTGNIFMTFPSVAQDGASIAVRGHWVRALDEFTVASGDVTGLIAAINNANSSGRDTGIRLAAGTYTLTPIDNNTDGPTLLPSIAGTVLITGPGSETTIIAAGVGEARLMHVGATGCLALQGVTLTRGSLAPFRGRGSAVFNRGELSLSSIVVTRNDNYLPLQGTALAIEAGVATVAKSSIRHNGGVGIGIAALAHVTITDTEIAFNADGIGNAGELSVMRSTISSNEGIGISTGGNFSILNSSVVNNGLVFPYTSNGDGLSIFGGSGQIGNTTIANNRGRGVRMVQDRASRLSLVNSTVTGNDGGGIVADNNAALLQNTIVALNSVAGCVPHDYLCSDGMGGVDCLGSIRSMGNNLIGVGCTTDLGPTDLVGDPGLGVFIDSGAPGGARVPLLAASRAVDAGAACAGDDQLDTPRLGACDIGAVEFYPVINDEVALDVLSTAFDPTPVPGGPAGSMRISVKYTNNSGATIAPGFVEVSELSGQNLLLNASRSLFGPGQPQGTATGGAGARVSLGNNGAGASRLFDLVVGLATRDPFTLFVNVYGAVQQGGF